MSDETTVKIRIPRPGKIKTDDRGRSVWAEPVETVEFELVSTHMLRTMLDADDARDRKAIENVADTAENGVLARNADKGTFEIIEDSDLQAILDSDPGLPKVIRPTDITLATSAQDEEPAGEELSLVSTQALKKVLGEQPGSKPESRVEPDPGGGFDPYNNT